MTWISLRWSACVRAVRQIRTSGEHTEGRPDRREAVKQSFNADPAEEPVRILICTYAARDRLVRDDDIRRLRDLHAEMDRAVLLAYGWDDLAGSDSAQAVFLDDTNEDEFAYQGRLFWPSEFRDEVLARLLALNAERHAEEVRRGIAPGMKGKTSEDDEEDVEDE